MRDIHETWPWPVRSPEDPWLIRAEDCFLPPYEPSVAHANEHGTPALRAKAMSRGPGRIERAIREPRGEAGNNRLAVLAADIRSAHAGVLDAAKTKASRAIDAGAALLEAKALLKHGRWLPWLKQNCRLPERTAQLYMKLANSGLPPEFVAEVGFEFAATATFVGTGPDYYSQYDEETQRQWLLFALLTECGLDHIDWLMSKGFASPDEWLSDDVYCRRVGMRAMPAALLTRWQDFKQEHAATSREDVEAALAKSATLADL